MMPDALISVSGLIRSGSAIEDAIRDALVAVLMPTTKLIILLEQGSESVEFILDTGYETFTSRMNIEEPGQWFEEAERNFKADEDL